MQLPQVVTKFSGSCKNEFEAKIDSSSEECKTILLIDDEEVVISTSEMMLKELGHNVLKAHSGCEGLQLFETNKFKIDLIISDFNMPEMDGQEVMHKLRKIDPHVKVMLSSGGLPDTDEEEVINRGFNGFIKKPYNMNTLCEKMSEILN